MSSTRKPCDYKRLVNRRLISFDHDLIAIELVVYTRDMVRRPRSRSKKATPSTTLERPTIAPAPQPRIPTPPAPTLPPPSTVERPLTLQELANFLKVSPITIRRMAAQKRLPFFRAGERVRFLPSQVLAALGAYRKPSK